MKAQDIFDKALGGVIRQGNLAIHGAYAACSYRTPDGRACGVGQLLDDETAAKLDACRDDPNGDSSINCVPVALVPIELHPHLDLLGEIQHAHDDAGSGRQDADARLLKYLDLMENVAHRNGLEVKFSAEDVAKAVFA